MQTTVRVFLLLSLAVASLGFSLSETASDQEAFEISERQLRQPIQSGGNVRGSSLDRSTAPKTPPLPARPSLRLPPPRPGLLPIRPPFRPLLPETQPPSKTINIVICTAVHCVIEIRQRDGKASELLERNIESFASKSIADFRSLHNEKVLKAALYRIPSSVLDKDVVDDQELLDGVLVTLLNGRRLMITHGPELWGDEQSAILEVEDLTDNWEFVESKNIKSSVVADYVSASDSSSNTKEAADRMMALD